MTISDWSYCPSCKFPALYSAFRESLESFPTCPLCNAEVDIDDIEHVRNPKDMLQSCINMYDTSSDEGNAKPDGHNNQQDQ